MRTIALASLAVAALLLAGCTATNDDENSNADGTQTFQGDGGTSIEGTTTAVDNSNSTSSANSTNATNSSG